MGAHRATHEAADSATSPTLALLDRPPLLGQRLRHRGRSGDRGCCAHLGYATLTLSYFEGNGPRAGSRLAQFTWQGAKRAVSSPSSAAREPPSHGAHPGWRPTVS